MTQIDSLWVNTINANVDSISNNVTLQQCKLDALQGKIDMLVNVVATTNDGVSNQLSATNILLVVVGVVMAVVGIILGNYIAKKKDEIEVIEETVENKKREIDVVAKTTKDLDEKINNDIESLYKRLRREETKTIISRLREEPLDILNLNQELFVREFESDDYEKLREAYLKLTPEDSKYESDFMLNPNELYLVLFFQDFCFEAIKDDDIRVRLIEKFTEVCNSAFKRDIIKSTKDLCRVLSDESSSFNKEDVLVAYLKAVNSSKHKTFSDIKNILEQNITPQALLRNAIERCLNEDCHLQMFEDIPPKEGEKKEE